MRMFHFTLILLLFVGFAQWAQAANRIVDDSCGNDGNGSSTSCAGSPGGAGAYNNLQTALSAVVAGETVQIRTGTYTTNNLSGDWYTTGFEVDSSGTSTSNRIKIKPYPGDTGVTIARNCDNDVGNGCQDTVTISAYNQSYVTFDFRYTDSGGTTPVGGGIFVHGGFGIFGDNGETENQVIGAEIDEGGSQSDGNWSAIRFERGVGGSGSQANGYIAYNYIHDIQVPAGTPDQTPDNRENGIKLYIVSNTIVEYNTVINTEEKTVDAKDNSDNNIIRFNLGVDSGPIMECFQGGCSGDEIYGNILFGTNTGFKLGPTGTSSNIHHNTVYNPEFHCLESEDAGPSTGAVTWANNICHNPGTWNIYLEGASTADIASADYNAYDSDKTYDAANISNQTTIAGWRSATGGLDTNSFEAATPCTFTTATADETGAGFHVTGTCATASSTSGEVGAYGAPGSTGCVGWTCDDDAAPPSCTPSKVVFSTQPGGGTGGVAWSTQPVVAVQDASSVTCTDATNSVTLAIGTNPSGGTLICTTNPLSATAGVATFAGCRINSAGTGYTLTAAASGLTGATSTTFNITVGAAAQVSFTTQPGGGTEDVAWTTQPVVTVRDAGDNTVTSATNSITLAIGTNPGSGTLGCTTNPLAATSGVASFAGCQINNPGTGYTLTAAASGLTGATSSTFNISAASGGTGAPGSPARLRIMKRFRGM